MNFDVQLPEGWSSKRLKYVASHNDDVLSEDTDELTEIDYVEISGVSLSGGIEEINRMRFFEAPSRARRKVRKDDILISTVRTYLKAIAAVGDASDDLVASTGFCVVRSRGEADAGFLGWVAKSEPFVSEVVARSVGVSYPAINASELVNINVPLPPFETQRRIAQFLDEKTARIDALIEKKRTLLDRLGEKRQALITHAVTKGFNPDAPLKPSGVNWLGNVPAHWEVLPVKRVAKLESGHTPDKKIDAYWENCDIPWVSLNDTAVLRSADYISDTRVSINALGLANSSARLLPPRAVVFTRDATIGESAITTRSMAVSQHIIAWLCNEDRIVPEFLLLVIYGMTAELLRLTNGSTIGTIGLSDVKSIVVALPPIKEQSEIVSATFDGKGKIAIVSNQIEASISRLIEYRAALITAAVTGKMQLEAMPRELALGEI